MASTLLRETAYPSEQSNQASAPFERPVKMSKRPGTLGPEVPLKNAIPGEVLKDILEGVSPCQAWREEMGWSLKDLAERTAIDFARIKDIDDGTEPATPDERQRMADAIGITAKTFSPYD